MTSKAITERQDERSTPSGGRLAPVSDLGPSLIQEDDASLARLLGMMGAALVIFGGMALAFNLSGRTVRVGSGWALLFLAVGMAGLLFHAAFDRDVQFRRMYMAFGFATLALGAILAVLPYPARVGDLFRWAFPCLGLSLLFFIAFLRNETDQTVRNLAELALGGPGFILALVGLVGGCVQGTFLLPYGLVLSLLGLAFLGAFIAARGISNDLAYYTALGLGGAGLLVVIVALGRSLLVAGGSSYFTSYGAVLLVVGFIYILTGACLASDSTLAVLTRRELGAFFFSPIAYLTLLGFIVLSWFPYYSFLERLLASDPRRGGVVMEPIVQGYVFGLFPVFSVVLAVPIVTMRLLSEEHRAGTLEVLLTAPVEETTVVLSKFIAALLTYLLLWLPIFLYLAAIPLSGGSPFDYRPLLSYSIALLATGSAFISSGLFFSSLTKSQIASGVLTGAFMMFLTFVYFPAHMLPESSAWGVVLKHMSYLDLWYSTLEGTIIPKFLLFFVSLTILFLFMTVKVLESRKWR